MWSKEINPPLKIVAIDVWIGGCAVGTIAGLGAAISSSVSSAIGAPISHSGGSAGSRQGLWAVRSTLRSCDTSHPRVGITVVLSTPVSAESILACAAVCSGVGTPVCAAVSAGTSISTAVSAGSAVSPTVRAAVSKRSAVGAAVSPTVRATVSTAVSASATIRAAVTERSAVGSTVGTAVRAESSTIGTAAPSGVLGPRATTGRPRRTNALAGCRTLIGCGGAARTESRAGFCGVGTSVSAQVRAPSGSSIRSKI
jgi:hypothetical protein